MSNIEQQGHRSSCHSGPSSSAGGGQNHVEEQKSDGVVKGDLPFVANGLARVRGIFAEMPGTEWTVTDAARLSGLEQSVCSAMLEALRHAGVLTQRTDGSCVRYRMPASARKSAAAL